MNNNLLRFGTIVIGVLLLFGVRAMTDRGDWIISSSQLPLVSDRVEEQTFTASSNDLLELEIEVDVSISDELRDRYIIPYIIPTDAQSALDIRWSVKHVNSIIASGDARDYLFVEDTRSLFGRLRRLIMQVPYERDEKHWSSIGLVGSRTISRGIGKFPVQSGETYTVSIAVGRNYPELRSVNPKATVRMDRKRWSAHYKQTRVLGYMGLLFIAVGLAVSLSGLFWRLIAARRT
jgi:hypothetical protein